MTPKTSYIAFNTFSFPLSCETAVMLDRFVCKLHITHRYKHPCESNILSTVEGERDVVVGEENQYVEDWLI